MLYQRVTTSASSTLCDLLQCGVIIFPTVSHQKWMLIRFTGTNAVEGPFIRQQWIYGGSAVINKPVQQTQFRGVSQGVIYSNMNADLWRPLLSHLASGMQFVILISWFSVTEHMQNTLVWNKQMWARHLLQSKLEIYLPGMKSTKVVPARKLTPLKLYRVTLWEIVLLRANVLHFTQLSAVVAR